MKRKGKRIPGQIKKVQKVCSVNELVLEKNGQEPGIPQRAADKLLDLHSIIPGSQTRGGNFVLCHLGLRWPSQITD